MLLFLFICAVSADVYMHNPRGANDRNCERNVNRNNGNLLYDTQNNAKGGYACPRSVAGYKDTTPQGGMTQRMEFEVGSMLELEWTAQHGCGTPKEGVANADKANALEFPNVHCEMVVEMGCTSTFDPAGKYGTFQTGAAKYPATPREGIPSNDGDAATNRINTNDGNGGQAYGTSTTNGRADNTRYGMHETAEFYNECNRVQRNKGLFTADQNVRRRSAIGTRQNPNGGRRGLECPEERDYYPYWRPTPFVGVAYLVDDPARCGAADNAAAKLAHASMTTGCGGWTTSTQGTPEKLEACPSPAKAGDWVGAAAGYVPKGGNVAQAAYSGACVLTATNLVPTTNAGLNNAARNLFNRREWPNNKADCEKMGETKVKWAAAAFHGKFDTLPQATKAKFMNLMNYGPVCKAIDQSRSNHLGNSGMNDEANRFRMTIPDVIPANQDKEACIVRLRYNMSSSDYVRNLNATFNGEKSPIKQDPLIQVGPKDTDVLQLAVNTNQVARTFQDRSYVFHVKKKAKTNEIVLNLNTRGKRGNIVQVYPAVEYDYVPNVVKLVSSPKGANDYPLNTVLDFQWTGSDYNPRRGCNDAEGGPYVNDQNIGKRLTAATTGTNQNSRADRNTMCEMTDSRRNYPTQRKKTTEPFIGSTSGSLFEDGGKGDLARKFAFANAEQQLKDGKLVANAPLNCLTRTEINAIRRENQRENHPRNCAEGNAISPYFESTKIKPRDKTTTAGGVFQMVSCRNNNFSNRDTKIQIFVTPSTTITVPPTQAPPVTEAIIAQDVVYQEPVTEQQIDKEADDDTPAFHLVENDGYKDGAKQGCSQEMYFGAASTVSSFNIFMVLIGSALYFF